MQSCDWSKRMADSVMERAQLLSDSWLYDCGVVLKGFEKVWKNTGDSKYFEYIKSNMDYFVDEEGHIKGYKPYSYNLDYVNNGKLLFTLYKETSDEKYKKAAFLLREQLRHQPRTSEGVFWHKKIYPYQIWLDGLYMGSPFYAQFIKEFGDPSEFDDVMKQFIVCGNRLEDPKGSGLLYHAWDEKHEMYWCDKATGLSPHFWGRSVGWFVMAIVDVLDYLPVGYSGVPKLKALLNRTVQALLKVQDKKSGVFYQVLDEGSRKGNYLEASCSSMICYAIAKGVRMGYLPNEMTTDANRIFSGLIEEFVTVTHAGLVNLNKCCKVAGLGGANMRDGSFAYYISEPIVTNDYKGVGAFIQASAEMYRLINHRSESRDPNAEG